MVYSNYDKDYLFLSVRKIKGRDLTDMELVGLLLHISAH